ncbi:tetratricopeptide repeat protein [Roseovarius atlanticus]|nr:tetratricopeptide repeat protein [Roseovarius atlanticus]MBY6123391.1 tetratricopeptide repeat protein [Roseovarius atlanticus]MBY6147886.1 tetratricopeptide repeat protein [Roseovarius atlanticus]
MGVMNRLSKHIVAALVLLVTFSLPAAAQDSALDSLFEQLKTAEPREASRISKEIELAWTRSGSATADLLLKRGRDALEAGDTRAAIEHFTALTDHAPDFAEGYHLRAMAYADSDMFGPALADIERALALNPRHYNAIASLGGILYHVESYAKAKQAFDLVLTLHPHHQEVEEILPMVEREIGGRDL